LLPLVSPEQTVRDAVSGPKLETIFKKAAA